MKIEHIDIEATIEKARRLVSDDEQLSAASKSMFEILILLITLLANRLNLNSTNSSKPPSSDPNRKKKPRRKLQIYWAGCREHTFVKVLDTSSVELSWLPSLSKRQVPIHREKWPG